MKKITFIFFSFFMMLSASAQIGIIQGLNSATLPAGWTQAGGFVSTITTPCEGSHAWRDNLYSSSTTGSFTSPNYVGLSNGTDLTVMFQWKATEWSSGAGVGLTANAEYSTNNGTTWLPIGDQITATSIIGCQEFTAVIPASSVPEGSDFRFRVRDTWTSGDCYFWIDNISITQVTALVPNCDAALTSPANGSSDANLLGVLTWTAATGLPSSYILSVGTSSGGNDVVAALNVGLATTYDIPGILAESTTYYVTITPTNANGNATDCIEYSFTTGVALPGDFCSNAIDLTNLTSPLSSTTTGATNTNTTVCNNSGAQVANTYGDKFYSIVVPAGSQLTIGATATGYDSANIVFYGDCENRTSIACFDDPNLTQIQWANQTGSEQTVYWIQDGWSATGTFTLAWSVIACTPPVATYTVVSDCENGEQFMVDVDVTNMGSATSISVSDNQGSMPQTVTATGIATFGPYPNATSVIFTVVNDQDSNCTLTSPARTQSICPPNCSQAEVISTCDEEHTAVLAAGNGSWNVASCGFSTPGVEKIYSFTPETTGAYVLQVVAATGGYVDYFYKQASGTCDNTGWICIDDNNGAGTDPIGTLTAGVEYLFLLDSEGTTARTHTFKIQCLPTCTNGTSTYTVVSDCENGEQFMVDVNVTSLGTASSVTVSDNQGSLPQSATATGVLSFGPYPNGTGVVFTTANDDDATCVWTSASTTQAICPPNCSQAEVISTCDEEHTAVLAAGNGSWNVASCGFSTPGVEKIYSFTPETTGAYALQVVAATGGYVDYFYKQASGTCDNTGWICIDDNNGAGTDPIGTLTAGVEYLFLLDSEGTTARTHTFKIQCLPTCTNGTSTYTVVSDCENGEQFMVDVNVTSLGTASSVTVSDNQGSLPQSATATGVLSFGPYPNNTSVIFTVANDDDATCVWTSPARTQNVCPPNCSQAEVISTCDEEHTAVLAAGNGSWNVASCGFSTPGVEKIYSFTPETTGAYVLQVVAATGGYVDYFYKQASGTCDNTGWICIDDNNGAGTDPIGTLTAGVEYLFLLDSEGTTARTHTFKIQCLPTCTNGTSTYTVVSDCENGEQFMVDVNVTSLGTASSVTVSDNQGSLPQSATATGVLSFGPYPNGTGVVFTTANDDDATCVWTSAAINQLACPPANDSCANAIELTPGVAFADYAVVGSNTSATRNAADPIPTCDNFNFTTNGKDVWYSVVAPASGSLTFETKTNAGTILTDTGLQVYSGTCGSIVSLGCNEDDGDGFFSKLTLNNLTPNEVLLVRVWGYNGSSGTFMVSAYHASLSASEFEVSGLKIYPNPVRDVLNLSYNQNISNVEVFNMLGQQVIAKSVNATNGQVDMSHLATGTYLVRVATDNQVKTIKVIKQ